MKDGSLMLFRVFKWPLSSSVALSCVTGFRMVLLRVKLADHSRVGYTFQLSSPTDATFSSLRKAERSLSN